MTVFVASLRFYQGHKKQPTSKIMGLVTKGTIPIKMAEDKYRFQVGAFLDTSVTLLMWDRSPQLRIQLARTMASSRLAKREKKISLVQSS